MFTSTLVTLLTYLFPLTGLGLMMSASQTFTYAYGPPAHPFKGHSIIIIYNITPLELFDFVLESSCESPEDGVACLLGQPPLVQIHLAGVTLHKHIIFDDNITRTFGVHLILVHLVPGMDLLNIDGRVTRLGNGRSKKGKEYWKKRQHGDSRRKRRCLY